MLAQSVDSQTVMLEGAVVFVQREDDVKKKDLVIVFIHHEQL